MRRYFPGKGIDWLKAKLEDLNDQLVAGKISTAGGWGDQSASFQRETSIQTVQQMVLSDLHAIDPSGGWAQHLASTTTKAGFNSGLDGGGFGC